MRRILLGGLGIALGVFARPAAAQDFPGRPVAAQTDSVNRAARLGRPVATPDAATAAGDITPAGLLTRGQFLPPTMTVGQPLPNGYTYPVNTPVPMVMPPSPGGASPLPGSLQPPRPMGGTPTITMIRDPNAPPATGGSSAGVGTPLGTSGLSMVPSVGPADCGVDCPMPTLDAPLGGYPSSLAPVFPAMNRLLGANGCSDRHWITGEYLAWWTRSTQLPVLAATGPIPAPGGMVTTPTPIFAGSFGETLHGGGRFSGGWWFSDDQRRGIDSRVFFLGRNGSSFNTNSATFPVLGRPFFNVNDPVGPLTDVIGAPGLSSGGFAAEIENSLWGTEINYRRFLAGTPCYRLDWLAGYRYLNFKETLTVTEAGLLDPSSPMIAAGRAPFAIATDRFRTENNFHGGQVGLTGELRRGRWYTDVRASIAFGTVFQTSEINGGQVQAFPTGVAVPAAGGLLALPGANIGTFSQNKFAVLPEMGINFGYHVTPHLRMFVGYNFLYLSSVLRPAGIIDTNVDASRVPNFLANPAPVLPGTPRPAPQFNTTDFWAQGISFGLQWSW